MLDYIGFVSTMVGVLCIWSIQKSKSTIPIYVLAAATIISAVSVVSYIKSYFAAYLSPNMIVMMGIALIASLVIAVIVRKFCAFVMLTGAVSNTLAVWNNNYKMPVFQTWSTYAGDQYLHLDEFHSVLNHKDKYQLLSDIIVIHLPAQEQSLAISIGDVLILSGMFAVMVFLIRLAKAEIEQAKEAKTVD